MAEIVSLAEAVARAIGDGDAVAMEGDRETFTRWLDEQIYAVPAGQS